MPGIDKSLLDSAHTLDDSFTSRLAIDDDALLAWAEQRGVSPPEAQLQSLSSGITPSRYIKNFSALTVSEQILICRSVVAVCGCGGLGGMLASLLARLGFGKILLMDGDVFVPSNLNRQLFCDASTLSRQKAIAAEENVRAINPLISVKAHPVFITEDNVRMLLGGADLVLDALDNLEARFLVFNASRELAIPFIHAAVAGWLGQICTFPVESTRDLRDIYGDRAVRDPEEIGLGVLGPTVCAVASMQALEALRLICGRPLAFADRLLYFDGESGRTELIPLPL